MKLKEFWEATDRDGLEMSYAQFGVDVSMVRRRHQLSERSEPQPPPAGVANDGEKEAVHTSTIRFRLTKT
jgi:hypothetical protein